MCRSNNCNCNRGWEEEGRCGERFDNCNNWNRFNECDPFEEVERIARRARNRRCREDRCARQFVRCMRAADCEDRRFNDGCCHRNNCCNR